jgi:hypothetical protein
MVFHTGQSRTCSEDQGDPECICGVYDYTNDKMFIHCYKKRNSHQFLDFIRRRVDSLYDSTAIKRIFLVLDNISIYIKQRRLEKYCLVTIVE